MGSCGLRLQNSLKLINLRGLSACCIHPLGSMMKRDRANIAATSNILWTWIRNLQIFKHKSSRAESKKLQHHHKIVEKIFVAISAPKIIVHNRRQQLVKANA